MEKPDDSNSETESDQSYDSTQKESPTKQINIKEKEQKKRGRPKKTITITATQPAQSTKPKKVEKKEELILHLPIYDEQPHKLSPEKNIFTMKDESDVEKSELISNKSSDNLKTKGKSKASLIAEIKKRDTIIKKLKETATENRQTTHYSTSGKDIQKNILNLKLVDINNNNKSVVIEKTDIACWWCAHHFNTIPCFIPDKYVDGVFYVFGCFCTYNCVLAYNMYMMNDHKLSTRISLIKQLYSKVFPNSQESDISVAPPKELLKMFGGTLSIEEYRGKSRLCKKEFKMNIPTIIPISLVVEEKTIDTKTTVVNLSQQKNQKKKTK